LTPLEDDAAPSLANSIGAEDPEISSIENSHTVQRLLSTLPQRDRQIITMRFFDGASQTQIAEELGISQMHVSRRLSRSLKQLRSELIA
jgi:RNA polymerase sigma-B factor